MALKLFYLVSWAIMRRLLQIMNTVPVTIRTLNIQFKLSVTGRGSVPLPFLVSFCSVSLGSSVVYLRGDAWLLCKHLRFGFSPSFQIS